MEPQPPQPITVSYRGMPSANRSNSATGSQNLNGFLYRRDSNISRYDICNQDSLDLTRSDATTVPRLRPMSKWLMKRSEVQTCSEKLKLKLTNSGLCGTHVRECPHECDWICPSAVEGGFGSELYIFPRGRRLF